MKSTKSTLALVMQTYTALLNKKLPPAGQPFVHNLNAEMSVLIDIAGTEDDLNSIDEAKDNGTSNSNEKPELEVVKSIECQPFNFAKSRPNNWLASILSHMFRLDALSMTEEIMELIQHPKRTLGHVDQPTVK